MWQADLTKIWASSTVGWAYLVSVIDCYAQEIVGWDLSNRCRTEGAQAAVERAVLERLPAGSHGVGLILTTDNGAQFTSTRFLETLARLEITHRYTAYHHPEGNSYIDRFHRSLKEEEVGLAEYRNPDKAGDYVGRYLGEDNHDRPHRGLRERTPRETYVSFESGL